MHKCTPGWVCVTNSLETYFKINTYGNLIQVVLHNSRNMKVVSLWPLDHFGESLGTKYLLFMMTSSNGNISALLALCVGNSPVTDEFPAKKVSRSFDVFFDLRLNKRLSWDAIAFIVMFQLCITTVTYDTVVMFHTIITIKCRTGVPTSSTNQLNILK